MSLTLPIRTFAVSLLLLAMVLPISAAPPQLVRYQGRLTDNAGVPLNGPQTLFFEIYNAPSGGTLLWSETQNGVMVDNGNLEVALGAATPIASTVFSGASAWLQVTVGGAVLTPRQQLMSVPYVLERQTLDDAYDAGGAGLGRTITADAGLVHIIDDLVGDSYELRVQNSNASGGGGIIIDRSHDARASQVQFSRAGSGEWYAGVLRSGGSPTYRFAISSNSDLNAGGREFVIANGNIGIGTSNPGAKLEVSAVGDALARLTSNDAAVGHLKFGNGTTQYGEIRVNNNGGQAEGTQTMVLRAGPTTDGIAIKNNGNVGIGTATPGAGLDITRNTSTVSSVSLASYQALFRQDGTVDDLIGVGSDDTASHIQSFGNPLVLNAQGNNVGIGTTSPGEQLSLAAPDAVVSLKSTRPGGRDWTVRSGSGNGGNEDNFRIYDKTGSADRLVIDDGGRVGFGTSSPSRPLDVVYSGTSGGLSETGLRLSNTSTFNSAGIQLSSSRDWAIQTIGSGWVPSGGLVVHDYTANATRLAIDASGNVGIGTATPAAKLDVDGVGQAHGMELRAPGSTPAVDFSNDGGSDFDMRLILTGDNTLQVTGGIFEVVNALRLNDVDNTTESGNALCHITATNAVRKCMAGSLRRLKDRIRDLELPGVETVKQLRPVEFDWKGTGQHDLGFVAEEVAEVHPLLASYDDGQLSSVKYAQLSVLLVKAIQEQQRQIDELRGEIENLKAGAAQAR